MRKNRIILLALSALFFGTLIGCGKAVKAPGRPVNHVVNTTTSPNNVAVINNTPQSPNQKTDVPPNVVGTADTEAAAVPHAFYQYINERQYEKAFQLLGPDLKADKAPINREFFKNMVHVDMAQFQDISADPGVIYRNYSMFYAVKFYYAVLTFKQYDAKLNPMLIGPQFRRFTVVKLRRGGQWLLDEDATVDPR